MRITGPAGTETRTYDAVLVANGHHWDPRWPEPAYPGTFDGEQIHAHDYRSGDQLAGRDVVVVGAGNSAMDIAVESSYVARTTTWSVRRTEWVLRKFFLGKPSDQVALPGWLPWWVTAARLRIGATYAGSMTKYGLPAPTHKPGQSHPVQSDRIRERLDAGAVTARPGIERLDGDRVVFVDGTTAPADLIVWATGYRVTLPVPRARAGVGAGQRAAAVEAHRPPRPPRPLLHRPAAGHRCGDADRRGAVGVDRRDARRPLRAARGRRRTTPDGG